MGSSSTDGSNRRFRFEPPARESPDMLRIATDTLPSSSLSYVAFRVALHDTLERYTLAAQVGTLDESRFGFLTEVPFLASVPPRVQLDLLSTTWRKHVETAEFEADLVEEAVVYAACETAARLVEDEPREARRYLDGGPLEIEFAIDHFLAAELRALHLNLANEGDFLLVSQFEDMPPERADQLKAKFGLEEERLAPMFDVLGRWHVSETFADDLVGLVEDEEMPRVLRSLRLRNTSLR